MPHSPSFSLHRSGTHTSESSEIAAAAHPDAEEAVSQTSLTSSAAPSPCSLHLDSGCRTCADHDQQRVCDRIKEAIAQGHKELGIVMLPGSFNPVHLDHIKCLQMARQALEDNGIAVVGGFLQPSSESYVRQKLGEDQAMCLQDRIHACVLAVEELAPWVGVWCSGEVAGSKETKRLETFFARQVAASLPDDARLRAFMVCGADYVEKNAASRWRGPAMPPKVVITRHGSRLPDGPPGEGWFIVHADIAAGDVSSTLVRQAIRDQRWSDIISNNWASPAVTQFLKEQHAKGALYMH
eukprot:CAMPEP_0178440278 /NCGR_PEP_ID=MMETSP0689_2-20121128/36675_1 /TAXON_ID=160604 /ORGANISM="Amphidinium massartii, Strain CS-259" /LENGTH=295 /DNA_ID=CAMNT_0020063005 /DNA_START=27 /DNA_END=914 /DNA_ORIENTATION=-